MTSNSWLSMLSRDFSARSDNSSGAPSLRAHWRWQLRRQLTLLGRPGIIALGLLLTCAIFYFSIIRPRQASLDQAQRNVVSVQEQILTSSKTGHGQGDSPAEQLIEFYKYFPAEKEAPQWLEKLVEVAEQNDLSINDGEYKVTQDKVGQLIRLRIDFPVQGSYPKIREFLASLARKIPPMALENVQFQRNKIVEATVEAKIKLVLYLVQRP